LFLLDTTEGPDSCFATNANEGFGNCGDNGTAFVLCSPRYVD